MKVIMSAYACEPSKGSEPEVGWRWMLEMSQHHDVVVITRANNRPVIEAYLGENPSLKLNVSFVYMDLSPLMLKLKKMTNALNWYYCLWQYQARKRINRLIESEEADLVHLVTFASFRYPVFLRRLAVPVIWGPIGGAEKAPWGLLFHRLRFPAFIKESLRNIATSVSSATIGWNNPVKTSGGRAIASTPRTQQILINKGIECEVMPTIGMEVQDRKDSEVELPEIKPVKFIFVGRLVLLKGVHFLIEALSELSEDDVQLTIVGDGEDKAFLKDLARELNVDQQIDFMGQVAKDKLPELYRSHHIVVAPSLYESGGFTVLEGFQECRPAIAFNVGGLALSIDETCGRLVEQENTAQSIQGLRGAMNYYLEQPEMIEQHGKAGFKKLKNQYQWSSKVAKMNTYYASVKE